MLIKLTSKDGRGFTLIELLFVVAILGILVAIAIPQFASYRKRSFNSAARSDIRNAATAQEAYYVDHGIYSDDLAFLTHSPYNLYTSEGVTLSVNGSASSYTIIAYHTSGNKTYTLTGPGGNISD